MDPVTITAIAQLVSLGLTIYQQIEAQQAAGRLPAGTVKPLADILAEADANFQQLQKAAQAALDGSNSTVAPAVS